MPCVPPTRTVVAVFPSIAVQEAKEKRRKVLEAARKVRRANYRRFSEKKRRLQAGSEIDMIA